MSTAPQALFSETLLLLGGAVVAAPLFRKLGLGTVLGYLAAGVVIGPTMHLITDSEQVLGVAELGVVFLLFVIGLELKPSRLWTMRKDIFGLGTAQVLVTGLVLAAAAVYTGLMEWRGALVAGFGLALSSTAFALQILNDQGDMNSRYGQRAFSVLLFQDLAIVPLLAMVSILGSNQTESSQAALADFGFAIVAIVAMIMAGRYLLTPLFQIIARTGAREVMIAAALFVVMGSALLMQASGLSMAMGAFLSGVMLAESSYRHELEADIEPFRGILLALFFMAVGLSMELGVIVENIWTIAIAVPTLMVIKAIVLYVLCRAGGSDRDDAARIALLLPQGGEFGFVLFTTAAASGLIDGAKSSLLISIVTLTMALTPLATLLARRLVGGGEAPEELEEDFEGAGADVLMIGFSRFGQIAAQILLASGRDVTIIDDSADRIRQAASFGFRIYFGDGTRLDVLRAAGVEKAKVVAICTQKKEVTDKIVDLISAEYPDARLFVRSYDRIHSLSLRARDVEYELRETLESGLLFGRRTIEALGASEDEAYKIGEDIRRRDEERLKLQASEGIQAGRHMLLNRPVRPEPLVKPKRVATDGFAAEAGLQQPQDVATAPD
ncbi:monovalent cation:proton antiporter-2 (CPA2) family protein [Rhizobium sp. S95]|uniref:Monovalent cation:proton antiporter-2 (CPA2) family protein n=1 Tax=Ciceribacter sichuanensis TaxID=2949647 RepID=A0AAJ1BS11_9HYPH|nr:MULTISPECIES: monovalent cation:proton antiporter-2 (CPA2) family protein [unclassified Ciceribacter]MCM2394878.1 monovalent cation:proton antiporter-2 (CPA2) family protein [Ciceribacter sp. S95]MCO5955299.1 monovalent cation:proton antiporter-2 (CPA2) family protein [Ciceribacter sp. S101]